MKRRITKPFLILSSSLTLLAWLTLPAQAEPDLHLGKYHKNLTYKGPKTGDEIIYTLYLPPSYNQNNGPYPLIFFLHGAGGGNASTQVLQSFEAARKAGTIGDFIMVFPEKYWGTVWRDGAKGKKTRNQHPQGTASSPGKEIRPLHQSRPSDHHGLFHGSRRRDLLGSQAS